MILGNISIKLVLNDQYKTQPYFSLEQAKEIAARFEESSNSNIYRLIPNKTDADVVLEAHNAYLVITEDRGRLRAYDNDGSFIISEQTIKESLIKE